MSLLRQRARPYLFSNSLPPAVIGCASKALDLLMESNAIVQSMAAKTQRCGPWQGWGRLEWGRCEGLPCVPAQAHSSMPSGSASAHTTSPAGCTGTQLSPPRAACLPTSLFSLSLPPLSTSWCISLRLTLCLLRMRSPVFLSPFLVCLAPRLPLWLCISVVVGPSCRLGHTSWFTCPSRVGVNSPQPPRCL